jgi:hypothetical protein
MTAPIRKLPEYELYRVILDYEGLQDGFCDRIEDLNTTLEQIEIGAEFAKGNVQKLLTKSPGRLARTFGWESLGKMLKGTGLALVLVVDDERFAPLKEQLAKRIRPKPANARMTRPTWLFTKDKAREMGTKRWAGISPAKRRRLAKRAAKARWKPKQEIASVPRSATSATAQCTTPQTLKDCVPRPI